ncbi:META domain-containing protein [Lentzea nigeriaca]|uniref:META domain-containing protein n=1 Tax=Lentzea nigeriaca TaxID=1128665 RepID=UPI00195704CB|nr:META domain-containing protein [Lentzea nigeriaca]MBM7859461.1 heat shock protein HslJ [Lentzea nigeriaca]
MTKRILLAALVVSLLVVASGCGGRSAGGAPGKDLRGKVFVSTSVTEQGKPRALVEGTSIELSFTDDGRLIARAGCNMMQGRVSLGDGKLSVSDLGSTAMGCPNPDLHKQDEWLSKLLSAGPSWELDGGNLVITGSDAEIVLGTEAPAALEGGTWTVDSLVTGDAVSSIPGAVTATVAFMDGKINVFTGCNSGSASYKVDGRAITFTSLLHTEKVCGPDQTLVEKALLGALSGQVTYKIDRQTLSLTSAKGDGVRLRK